MKKIIITLLCGFICFNVLQAQTLIYAKQAGSDTMDSILDQGNDIVMDPAGNSYVTGIMSNWTTGSVFGAGEANETILYANGAFVAKYDPTGLLLWAIQIGDNNFEVVSNAITLDPAGNVYITGYFQSEITFDPGLPTAQTFTANGNSRDIFFAKFDTSGQFIWAKTWGGTGDDASGENDIELDSNGNIYLTGAFNGTVVFGSGEPNETTLNGNNSDIFLAKYDANGALIWAVNAGGANNDSGRNLDLDSNGNIYLTGNFYNEATFGLNLNNETSLTGSTEAGFIAKYDNDGNFQWARSPFIGSPNTNIGVDIKVLDDQRIVYLGTYTKTNQLTDCVSVDSDSDAIIMAQYDANGEYIWNTTFKSQLNCYGLAMDIDSNGFIYITGLFAQDALLNEGLCNETTLVQYAQGSMFLAAYDQNGQFLSATSVQGTDFSMGRGISVNNTGTIAVTGYFDGDTTFGPSEPNETTLVENGVNEIFVSKYQLDLNSLTGQTYAGESNCIEVCENADPVDLFTALLNNPDSGGVWTPALNSGSGVFDPNTDTSGVYRYSVSEGNCISDYAEITVDINGTINPGENATVNICIQDDPFDLTTALGGTPDAGGTWTPALTSGTTVFDPAVDTSGIYTYSVSSAFCGTASAELTVNVVQAINAGSDGSASLCENDTAVDLFRFLNGNPNSGGTWTPNLTSGSGLFDPAVDASGMYTYTVSSTCETLSADVTVTVNTLPNAGQDANVQVCETGDPIDLFTILTGTPDAGGQWSPALSGESGMFDPKIDNPGVYTYTVTNACSSSSASVSVNVTAATPVTGYDVLISDYSSNNLIEIVMNTDLEYEFALNNGTYQSSPVFRNLGGGDYIISIQEKNGCGEVQIPVSLIGFPKYFTPNNDGFNDTWKIIGQTDKRYSISIYNRYGKLLKSLPDNDSRGWDGTYRGKKLPSDDYWFRIEFEDGMVRQGHFALKR
ncbi:T9SS type B sorting domain-containing protein [Gaetbulibacter aestuarii]|uniref:T9SS type B sorting domain-containing protein n=1 Tax=Gaetbulibacter aestuarii TaxID=1502358 RepID=A0ABW7N0W5_9FLAO